MKRTDDVAAAILAILLVVFPCCQSQKPGHAPTLEEACEVQYQGIYDLPIRLVDGRYEGKTFVSGGVSRPTVRLIGDLIVAGDLDCDGNDESAVLLVEDSGGSGSSVFIAVLRRNGQVVENVSTSQVGDRVQVRALRIDSGRIIMDVVQPASGDAMCCPTQKARRSWELNGEKLVEAPPDVTGKISIADLAGIEWVLTEFDTEEQASSNTQLTLVFEDGRIYGSGGCNRYFAEITEDTTGVINIEGIGTTRMACEDETMHLEARFLEALNGAAGYGFLAGRLSLTCRIGDRPVTLLFESGEPE